MITGAQSFLCPNDTLTVSNYHEELSYQWTLDNKPLDSQISHLNQIQAANSGNYAAYAKNPTNGCRSKSDTFAINLYIPIQPVILEKKEQGILSMLFVDNTNKLYIDYHWIYADGNNLPSEMDNNRQFLLLAGSNIEGQYIVNITDTNGCKVSSDVKTVSESNVSSTIVYPTINNGNFRIYMMHPDKGDVIVKILNESGIVLKQMLFNKPDKTVTLEMNINNAIPGKYLVEVMLNNYQSSQWIIAQ